MASIKSNNPQRLARMEQLLNQLIKKNDTLRICNKSLHIAQRIVMLATLLSLGAVSFSALYNSQTDQKNAPTENLVKTSLGLAASLFMISKLKCCVRQASIRNAGREKDLQFRLAYHARQMERNRE